MGRTHCLSALPIPVLAMPVLALPVLAMLVLAACARPIPAAAPAAAVAQPMARVIVARPLPPAVLRGPVLIALTGNAPGAVEAGQELVVQTAQGRSIACIAHGARMQPGDAVRFLDGGRCGPSGLHERFSDPTR